MNTMFFKVLGVTGLMAGTAFGQSYGTAISTSTGAYSNSYSTMVPMYGHASTVAEGYYRGVADLGRAAGEYNYNTSLAEINDQEAYRRYQDNRLTAVKTYFEMRRINAEARAAEIHYPTPEEARAMAKMGVPNRLTALQYEPTSGALHWPTVLEDADFGNARSAVENMMMARQSGVGSPTYQTVAAATAEMEMILKAKVHNMTPAEYVQAKKFIESVRYESQVGPNIPGVAAN